MTIGDPTLAMHAFLVTHWDGEPVNAAPEEHDDLRWFRPSELADLKLAHPASLSSILRAVQVATAQPLIGTPTPDRKAQRHESDRLHRRWRP
jgi:hypothetical protein